MSSFFKTIGSFFKKLFSALKKILAVVLVILAVIVIIWACIFCPPLGGVLFGIAFSSATMAFAFGCVLLVGAFLIDKSTASKVVGKIGEATGDAAESVGSAVGNVTSGVLDGIFGSGLGTMLLVGVGAYILLSSSAGSQEVANRPSAKLINARDEGDDNRVADLDEDVLYG